MDHYYLCDMTKQSLYGTLMYLYDWVLLHIKSARITVSQINQ